MVCAQASSFPISPSRSAALHRRRTAPLQPSHSRKAVRYSSTFNAPVVTQPPAGLLLSTIDTSRVALSVADFNRDGIGDVAVLYQNDVVVYPGSGKGYFNPGVKYDTTIGSDFLATGDVNGDGIPDIVTTGIAIASNRIQDATSVLLANADGTFRALIVALTPYVISQFTSNWQAYLVDVNHDGKVDLIDSDGVALGNGDGTFGPTTPLPTANLIHLTQG